MLVFTSYLAGGVNAGCIKCGAPAFQPFQAHAEKDFPGDSGVYPFAFKTIDVKEVLFSDLKFYIGHELIQMYRFST